jgi:SAM-dependent methyltransferase
VARREEVSVIRQSQVNDGGALKMVRVLCPMCQADAPKPFARGHDFEYETSDDEFTVARCGGCGVLYLNPRPHPSELARIYPESYAPYHFDQASLTLRVRNYLEGRKVRKLRARLPEKADILDAGCGGPGFLENLRRFGSSGWRLWGNDVSSQAIAELEYRGFRALPGRLEEVDLPPASFDAIFLKQVIEHLDAPQAVLVNAARLLRPGGYLIVETPNVDAWDAKWFCRRYWGGYHFPRHWTLYDAGTLSEAGRRSGLVVDQVRYMLSPCFWAQAVHHALKDRGWPRWIYRRFSHFSPPVMCAAALIDVLQLFTRRTTSNMRLMFRKPQSSLSTTIQGEQP